MIFSIEKLEWLPFKLSSQLSIDGYIYSSQRLPAEFKVITKKYSQFCVWLDTLSSRCCCVRFLAKMMAQMVAIQNSSGFVLHGKCLLDVGDWFAYEWEKLSVRDANNVREHVSSISSYQLYELQFSLSFFFFPNFDGAVVVRNFNV